MSQLLTSWKEIANHFGKGVRTVQRWEVRLGLPVHRPDQGAHNIVFAIPEELNLWVARLSPKNSEISEMPESALVLRLKELELENSKLRRQLASVTREPNSATATAPRTMN